MRIALAQINPILGDIIGNCELIFCAALEAQNQGAILLITPELSITGYPPEDLLFRESFNLEVDSQIHVLASRLVDYQGLYILVGHPTLRDGNLFNVVSILNSGKVINQYIKQILPNSEVFDEARYFKSGADPLVLDIGGILIGVLICEDAWHSNGPACSAKNLGAELLVVLNASPFHRGKSILRKAVMSDRCVETGLPLVYLNMIGGQDELVFDGGSFALNKSGVLRVELPQFEEQVAVIDFVDGTFNAAISPIVHSEISQIYSALVLGLRDYARKNGFKTTLLGLSGGVDSALVLCLATDALGSENVHAVMMPSLFTANISLSDARELAKSLLVKYTEIKIDAIKDLVLEVLSPAFSGLPEDATEENIQARIRSILLMGLSNKFGSLLLTTGNKSEYAVGYCTLYGDMSGGFAVLKDVSKTLVYELCRFRNSITADIPQRILNRAPSAELRANQKDDDTLPSYAILDEIMERYVEGNESISSILESGISLDDINKVTMLLHANEYKRKQSAIGTRVTNRAFGKDWRYPITNKFRK